MTPVTGTKTVDIQRKISVTGLQSTRDTAEESCRGIVQRKNSPHFPTLFGLFFPSLWKLTGIIHKKFTVYSNRLPAFFYYPDNRTKRAGEVSPPFIFHVHITENLNVRQTSSVMRSGVPASEKPSTQKAVQQHDSADFVFRDKTCDIIFYGRMVISRCVSTVFSAA